MSSHIYIVNNGIDFEKAVKQMLEDEGFKCDITPESGDQGVDVIAHIGDQKVAIQCKFYMDSQVGNDAVQQVFAGSVFWGCRKAIVVSNSHFTKSARELAKATDVALLHYNSLRDKILEYQEQFRQEAHELEIEETEYDQRKMEYERSISDELEIEETEYDKRKAEYERSISEVLKFNELRSRKLDDVVSSVRRYHTSFSVEKNADEKMADCDFIIKTKLDKIAVSISDASVRAIQEIKTASVLNDCQHSIIICNDTVKTNESHLATAFDVKILNYYQLHNFLSAIEHKEKEIEKKAMLLTMLKTRPTGNVSPPKQMQKKWDLNKNNLCDSVDSIIKAIRSRPSVLRNKYRRLWPLLRLIADRRHQPVSSGDIDHLFRTYQCLGDSDLVITRSDIKNAHSSIEAFSNDVLWRILLHTANILNKAERL